ncbi:hypothetical protein [methane-oxidizing endosymbiont of Gigantopelta aegis]|uniref:hypothetical protein n=1 Tax=methane-oxidizing endosymbiont of Gigantopelta aegis TaxID=2794938 RepID=UPI0018DCFA33|nr:hypothetical protein [methane-oxidizing endosymbiont of Gigantopelta aegis]
MQKITNLDAPFISLIILFLVAPFYMHPNIGGLGLAVPFNIAVWLVSVFFSCFTLIYRFRQGSIQYNPAFLYCLIFPVILIISGLFSNIPQAEIWFFRQLYILGGFVFLFALLQTQLKSGKIDYLLYILFLASVLHALIGIAQITDISILHKWIPFDGNHLPIGVFQQINVEASFLTSGFIIGLYLISRPSFSGIPVWIKGGMVIGSALLVFVIVSSGSRMGLLSLIVATILMLSSRHKQLSKHKKFITVLGAVAISHR